ncbi:phosphoglycerate dehydrogenase [Aquibacillus halophilus]|uniref:D-3-phosphoglycerate dehydrogenase n=1 Tax=Aquibacillus halophilus TaxID=930132 RepID=A0A6A8DFA0_9BACI|nr:phosphoglycerate dehydrogenase [Aquibacillus halophilus]MRH44388.1 phosphoglycerate dehydrogenase [Aquibacillus halophilus]
MIFKVLISDPLSEEGIQPLREADNIEVTVETNLSPEQLKEKIGQFDALLVRSQTKVTREIISSATNLKIIGRAGVGVDNIDLDAATEHGVIVVNAPDGNTNSAAEHTMAMLMSLARKIPQAYYALKHQKWDRKSHVGVELKNKTLGVVGLGRIGAEVAARAKGQRMKIIAYDPFLTEEKAEKMGIDYGTVEDVLRKADFITVHTPLLKETKHLINADAFKIMKDGVQIINCARGGIIDEDALYDAIVNKKVAGAALDVFEEEPAVNHKLLELPEVIATPHLGASTIEAQENVAIDVSDDVVNFLTGGLARNPVNLPSVPKELMNKIEPYFLLSEKLGAFLTRLTVDVIEEVNIYYSGELAEVEVAPLTRNTLKGLLKRHLGEHVNDVNASFLADKKGITVNEHKTSSTKGFTNLLTVEVKTKKATRLVSGTLLNGLGARIVKVDNYSVDVVPEGHLVFIRHKDQPGAIGRVGSLLAEQNINIATMQVGRSDVGGDAIMMLTIDKNLEELDLEKLNDLADIYGVVAIDL